MGKIKTTITLDEEVWKRFTILVIEKYGSRKKNQVLEQLIKEYIKEHEWPMTLDAIWAYEKDILELRNRFKENVWTAHVSQPWGIPLHRYKGQLILEEGELLLSGKDKDTGEPYQTLIPMENITETFLGWDDTLRRWKDTRALIRPLRVKFEDNGKSRTLYIYAKRIEGTIYGRENKKLREKMESALKMQSTEK